jgi:iron complex outermembrane receptor protein
MYPDARFGINVFVLEGSYVKFNSKVPVLSVAATVMAIVAASSAARAAEDQGTLEEIVVTAQFRTQKLQDTPIAITAVNAAMLEARGQTSITEIAAQAPSVSLRPQGQGGGTGLIAYIRGVGQTDFIYAVDPGVGVYVDDVYIPTLSSSLLELMDLDRVEILRGPQGTLAGKNSIGGAIKLFSAKPQGDDSGSFKLSYGSFNEVDLRGMADLKLTDTLALRISGMSHGVDGYVGMLDYGQTHPTSNVPQNTARGNGNADYATMGGQNHVAGRAALRWTPSDQLEVNVSADYTRENDDVIPNVLIAAGKVRTATGTFDPFSTGVSQSTNLVPTPSTTPWLVGKNGQQVNMSCAFVPAGAYSCDTGGNLHGWKKGFVSYSSFLDGMQSRIAAPYKPYASLPLAQFTGSGVMANISYHLNDNMELVYIGSYREYESKFGQDQDATPIPVAQLDNQLNHHAFTSEARFNFKSSGGFLEGTAGLFYLDQQGTYTARVDLNYVSPVIDFLHGPDLTPSTTKAIFGTATIHPTEALSFTGGLRYTEDQKDYTYFRSNPDGTQVNAGACFGPGGTVFSAPNCILAGIYNITGSFKGDRTDWRLVADYRFTPDLMAYVSASTGFKGGGVNPRPFVADQRLPFKPETLTTYEAGLKSDLFDRHVRLNGAVFFNKYEDIQLNKAVCPESSLPAPCARPDNIGAADVKGAELEVSIYPGNGFSFDGSISYLNFNYTSPTTAAGNLVNTSIPKDSITPYTPELTYSVGGQYDHMTDAGTFSIRLDAAYQGDIYTNAENTVWSKIDSRILTNARLSWSDPKDVWKMSLEIKNLTDEYYFQTKGDATTSLGTVSGVPGLPRTFLVSVERKFN